MTLAYLRPDSWHLPLFLHVLGAVVLFGGTLAVTILAVAGTREGAREASLSRLAFRTMLLVVLPSWLLTRIPAQWLLNREQDQIPGLDDKGWVGVGFVVTEGGLLLLVVAGVLAFLASRREGRRGLLTTVAILGAVYLVALGVAWFAMSAKPGS